MLGLPAAASKVGNQSKPEKIPFWTVPGLMCPGQRAMQGTRNPPSKTVPLVARNGVIPPSGHVNTSAPLSVVKMTNRVVGLADVVDVLHERADGIVHLRHPGLLEAIVGLAVLHRAVLLREEGPDVHASRVVPEEERLPIFLGLVHELARRLDEDLVEGRHVILGFREREVVHVRDVGHVGERRERPLVDDPLLANFPQRGISVVSSLSVA